jgi:xanthine dehydrogenase iron-sulfur cluster and FAD-binding subunit A
MAAKALLDENPDPTRAQIQEQMDGHICRCTGYNMIIEAIQDSAKRLHAREGSKKLPAQKILQSQKWAQTAKSGKGAA